MGSIAGAEGGRRTSSSSSHGNVHGAVDYEDDDANVDLHGTRIQTIACSGHNAHITGQAKLRPEHGYVDFTIDVTDGGPHGQNDSFAITIAQIAYANGGPLLDGDIELRMRPGHGPPPPPLAWLDRTQTWESTFLRAIGVPWAALAPRAPGMAGSARRDGDRAAQ